MRLPDSAHTSRPWRIHEFTRDSRAQIAVLVKPNGLFGTAYMAAIRPFRHLVVYPAMLREGERAWQAPARTPWPCSQKAQAAAMRTAAA